jgi:dienelactone hydrolase
MNESNIELIPIGTSKRLRTWLQPRLATTYELDTRLWRTMVASLWAFGSLAIAITALGMPTGFGSAFDIVTGITLHTIAMSLTSAGIAMLLAVAGLRVPRFTAGSLLYVGILVGFILYFSDFGWQGAVVYAVVYTLLAATVGLTVGWLVMKWASRRTRVWTGMAIAIVATYVLYSSTDSNRSDKDIADAPTARTPVTANFPDPSQPGNFTYRYFTYGSGNDHSRPEFGKKTDLISPAVNASVFIQHWPWLRKQFWGFDETELPLNGRVWMPEGEGPFPIVLIVHGNHLMENFSDEGYGYLGELLASRGIIAVSVDENFLNYSVWSGIPDREMEVRAWMLLKHIQQIKQFNNEAGNPFSGKVDLNRIALLGHSRGGQAAAMAADKDRWFGEGKESEGLSDASTYSIKAVVALAPTDTEVDEKQSNLKDISYLVLQGALDSDLINFYGDRQYGRTMYSGTSEAFKTSLYIEDANHSQFNTEWGSSDNAYPTGVFIHTASLLKAGEQRQIAKVYVSAFLESVFHEDDRYEPLFQDYRNGLGLLPSTAYYNQYESGSFSRLADFEGDNRSVLGSGLKAEALNMKDWQHIEAKDRQGNSKGNQGVALEWQQAGSYTVHLSSSVANDVIDEDILTFSMANLAGDLDELDEETNVDEEEGPDEKFLESALNIDIELTDRSGHKATLPLSRFMNPARPGVSDFTWLPGMDSILSGGKFTAAEEPVYQSYDLPLADFADANPDFDLSQWVDIRFIFKDGPGKVMLDELGLMSE